MEKRQDNSGENRYLEAGALEKGRWSVTSQKLEEGRVEQLLLSGSHIERTLELPGGLLKHTLLLPKFLIQ